MQKNCWIFPTALNRVHFTGDCYHPAINHVVRLTPLMLSQLSWAPRFCYLKYRNKQDEWSQCALICNMASIHFRLKEDVSLNRPAFSNLQKKSCDYVLLDYSKRNKSLLKIYIVVLSVSCLTHSSATEILKFQRTFPKMVYHVLEPKYKV